MVYTHGTLTGLSEQNLLRYLAELRRIATLPDAEALAELDTFAWGLRESVAQSSEAPGERDWLGQSREERAGRFRQEVQAARKALTDPAGIRPFDSQQLRQAAAIFGDDPTARSEALALANELDIAHAGAELERALRAQVASTAALPKQFRIIEAALSTIRQHGRITVDHEQCARAARERLARWRSQKKLDEAEVAAAGGNAKKADRLRREAAVILAQDWPRAFPGEAPPALADR